MTALAHYIASAKHFSLLIENDKRESALSFEMNNGLTLRMLLGEEALFIKLALKVVAVNEAAKQEDFTNVLILDKLRQHEAVLRYLIKIQMGEFERKVPSYFVLHE